MKFVLIIECLCIFLHSNAKSKLSKCSHEKVKKESGETLAYSIGQVCTKISCDWTVDDSCQKGTRSEVLEWDGDIFEVGFQCLSSPVSAKEVIITIDLNVDFYIQMEVISDKEKESVTVILKECSHSLKKCMNNLKETNQNIDIFEDEPFVAIGFRKDKKINFKTVCESKNLSTNFFGLDNEYELKMPGFYFNTNDTMNITVSSKFDQNYTYDGVLMILPTSVGGFFFNKYGYLIHDDDYGCLYYYTNPNMDEGLPYIIKEYFEGRETWRAPPLNATRYDEILYFNEDGMRVPSDKMKIIEEKNPDFDEAEKERKGCVYVDIERTTILKEESTLTEPEITKRTTISKEESTMTAEEVTKRTKPEDLAKNSQSTPEPPFLENEDPTRDSSPEESTKKTRIWKERSTLTVETTLMGENVAKKIILKKELSSREEEVTETTKPVNLMENRDYVHMPLELGNEDPLKGSFLEGRSKISLPKITIGNVNFIKITDPSESDIKLPDFFDRVGKKLIHQDYFQNGGIEGDEYMIKLINGSLVYLKEYKFANSNGENKKIGSGGGGDTNRGEIQVKIALKKYFLFLILLNLSFQKLFNFIE